MADFAALYLDPSTWSPPGFASAFMPRRPGDNPAAVPRRPFSMHPNQVIPGFRSRTQNRQACQVKKRGVFAPAESRKVGSTSHLFATNSHFTPFSQFHTLSRRLSAYVSMPWLS